MTPDKPTYPIVTSNLAKDGDFAKGHPLTAPDLPKFDLSVNH